MKQLLACILSLFLHYSYAQGIDVVLKEKQIKRALNTRPDSARIYIKEILNYKGRLHDTVYSNTYLAYGYYYNQRNNADSALYYYNLADNYVNDAKYPRIYARILRNKANTNKKRGHYDEALKQLALAEEYYKNGEDETGLAVVYGDMASNFNLQLRSEDAVRYLLKAIDILERKKDRNYIYTIKLSLANTYINEGQPAFAASLYPEIIRGFKEIGQTKNHAVAQINYGDCLLSMKKYPEALAALSEALPELEKFGDQDLIGITYAKMGRMYALQNKAEEAEHYYSIAYNKALASKSIKLVRIGAEYLEVLYSLKKTDRALKVIESIETPAALQKADLHDRANLEAVKAKIYQKANNPDMAIAALENRMKLQDELLKRQNQDTVIKLQEQYARKVLGNENKQLETKNNALHEKAEKSRKANLAPLLCIALLCGGVISFFIVKNHHNKKRLKAAHARKEVLLKEYENTKTINLLHKENIEAKKQELVSGIVTLTTLEGNIGKLVSECSTNPSNLYISEIKGQLESLTSDKDYWNLFRKRFNEAYAGFQNNLEKQFPNLTKNDLFFCALLKLNLPYKDMATLMQVSPESIVKKKYRIKKRMGIESEQELDNILLHTQL